MLRILTSTQRRDDLYIHLYLMRRVIDMIIKEYEYLERSKACLLRIVEHGLPLTSTRCYRCVGTNSHQPAFFLANLCRKFNVRCSSCLRSLPYRKPENSCTENGVGPMLRYNETVKLLSGLAQN